MFLLASPCILTFISKRKKLQSLLSHCCVAMGAHIFTKNRMTEWLLLYLSICSINSSACLTASSSLCLSVSSQLPQYVCHYCLSVSFTMLACLPTCLPVLLSVFVPSLHSQASLAVWAAFCHLAEGWSAGVILWRHEDGCLSLGTHAGDSTNRSVAQRHSVAFSN